MPVFDRGRDPGSQQNHLAFDTLGGAVFRRNARDNEKPTRVVTAQILGDPIPGRSAQDKLNARR